MRRHLMDLNHEEFWIVMLMGAQAKYWLLQKALVSEAALSGTVADPKIVFHAGVCSTRQAQIYYGA